KEKDSFFSKLKDRIGVSERREREAATLSSSPSSAVLNPVAAAASTLANVSAAHPPPVVLQVHEQVARRLDSMDALYGLAHRCVALHSLEHFFAMLQHALPLLEQLLPSSCQAQLSSLRELVSKLS